METRTLRASLPDFHKTTPERWRELLGEAYADELITQAHADAAKGLHHERAGRTETHDNA
jgi:hypothetical protein